jgi:mannose-1-phosphate guanylyltransferase
MKAMILAAGRGTRVRPITNDIPKPMIPLIQKPVLESILEHLKNNGINEIIINTSYLSTQIEQYFGNGSRFGVQIAYSFEGEKLDNELVPKAIGSAGGMKKIQDETGFFDDTFLVLCADALIDLDIQKVLEVHKQKKSIATIALKNVSKKDVSKYGIVKLNDQDKILSFQEKPDIKKAVSTLANTGIYIFEPEIFDFIPSNVEYDIGGDLLPDIVSKELNVYGANIPYEWIDIGNVNDFYDATCKILKGDIQNYKIFANEIEDGIFLGLNVKVNLDKVNIIPPVFIGSSTKIDDGATIIGPSMIGSNCHIKSEVILKETIIDDYKKINFPASISKKIVFSNSIIALNGDLIDTKKSEMNWLVEDIRVKQSQTLLEKNIEELLDERVKNGN